MKWKIEKKMEEKELQNNTWDKKKFINSCKHIFD